MKIIADSGSTKTEWFVSQDGSNSTIQTLGINPCVHSTDTILEELNKLVDKLPSPTGNVKVYFYGAGCIPSKIEFMQECIIKSFGSFCNKNILTISVESDLLGAARSLFGQKSGIACILGTGANSCYYENGIIKQNTPPLGFILGDEGSGAAIGKNFITKCLRHTFPEWIITHFLEDCGMNQADFIDNIYRKPRPNAFLASLTKHIIKYRGEESVHAFLIEQFRQFFINHILVYKHNELPISLIGSIAYYFKEEITEAAHTCGLTIGKIERAPMNGLIKYHEMYI